MSNFQTYIDPVTTQQLLSNLSLAIDETKLLRSIEALDKRISYLKTTQPDQKLIDTLNRERTIKTAQLNYIRDISGYN